MLFPVDEALTEPELLATRVKLLAALRTMDRETVLSLLADDVRLGLDPNATKTTIINSLQYGFGNRTLVEHIVDALTLGGNFTTTRGSKYGEREFCAPYVYSAFPSQFEHFIEREDFPWVITGRRVPLRSKPRPDGPIRRYLSYDIVFTAGQGAAQDRRGGYWQYTVIDEPRTLRGFVDSDSIRDPSDYHVCLGSKSGRWQITEIMEDVFPSLRDQGSYR